MLKLKLESHDILKPRCADYKQREEYDWCVFWKAH